MIACLDIGVTKALIYSVFFLINKTGYDKKLSFQESFSCGIYINSILYPFSENQDKIIRIKLIFENFGILAASSLVPSVLSFSSIATSPEHVKQLAENAKIQEKKNNDFKLKKSNKNLATLFYDRIINHKKIVSICVAGTIGIVGFFAIKKNDYATTTCSYLLNLINSFSSK